ncbi:hypothetical protein [Ranid herpesvirus 3]|uniref:Uncharacterized protein n=1 Tax=Ranid herpesvirus 3 TaxID=1987509 RepID=A0A1X9T5B2_9VIRU|nr:hypothetical protein [Ranid herpesvirus 3]ARR28887.1 hypothetical protein [Ranid herpesvirus 3]
MNLPSLNPDSFLFDEVRFGQPSVIFFLSLSRGETQGKTGTLPIFRNIPEHKQQLLEILLFLTHALNGRVLTIYLEPDVLTDQHVKCQPFIRNALCDGLVMLFVFPTSEEAEGGFPAESPNDLQTALNEVLTSNDKDIRSKICSYVKKIICLKMGLVGFYGLWYKIADDCFLTDMFKHVNFITASPLPTVELTLIKHYGGLVGATSTRQGKDAVSEFLSKGLSVKELHNLTSKYFYESTEDIAECVSGYDGSDASNNFIMASLWHFQITNIVNCPIFSLVSNNHPHAPAVQLLTALARQPPLGVPSIPFGDRHIAFEYQLGDLIQINKPCLYKDLVLHHYPPMQNIESASIRVWASELLVRNKTAYETQNLSGDDKNKHNFRLIFPHLSNINELLRADKSLAPNSPATYTLIFTLLLDASGIKTENPTVDRFYGRMRKQFELNDFCAVKALALSSLCVSLKGHYAALIRRLFVESFAMTRLKATVVMFHYIISNTALRWRISRQTIINCSQPGHAKSFSTEILKELFGELDLVHNIGSFSARSFQYQREPQLMYTQVLDDVAMGSDMLKLAKNENSTIPGLVKNILDKSIVISETTQRTEFNKESAFFCQTNVAVQNVGLIWNCNSFSVFSDAMLDRAIVFVSDVSVENKTPAIKVDYFTNTDRTMGTECESRGLKEMTTRCTFRTHLFCTLVNLVRQETFTTRPQHDIVIAAAQYLFFKKYASYASADKKQSSKTRTFTGILDMATDRASFLATAFVFDLWVPPWTKDGDREQAISQMGWPELMAECAAVYHLLLPGCIVEVMPTLLGKEISAPLKLVTGLIKQAVEMGVLIGNRNSVSFEVNDRYSSIETSLVNERSKQLINELSHIQIPRTVYGINEKPWEKLLMESKILASQGTNKTYTHTLTFAVEPFLSVLLATFPQALENILQLIAKSAIETDQIKELACVVSLPPLNALDRAILKLLTMCPRLGVNFEPTSNRVQCGRYSGIRLCAYRLDQTIDLGTDASSPKEEYVYGAPKRFFDGCNRPDVSLLTKPVATYTVLTKDTNAVHIYAKEFSSDQFLLSLDEEIQCHKLNENERPFMPHVQLPKNQTVNSLAMLNLTTNSVDITKPNLVVLKRDYEYILAAREYLAFTKGLENPSDELLILTARKLKDRYRFDKRENAGNCTIHFDYQHVVKSIHISAFTKRKTPCINNKRKRAQYQPLTPPPVATSESEAQLQKLFNSTLFQ